MRSLSHPKAVAAVACIASIGAIVGLSAGAQATEVCPPGVSPPSPYCRNVPPVAKTAGATGVHATRATLHGIAGPGVAGGDSTSYRFQYGKTKTYGSATSTRTVPPGPASVSVLAFISGLRPGTRYHYRIDARNTDGSRDGVDRTFRTSCPAPTGEIKGLSVGPLKLGMTLRQAMAVLPLSHTIVYGWDNFCLTPGLGIRVHFATNKLLSLITKSGRASITDKILIALTANTHYQVNGVRHGTPVKDAIKKLGLGPVTLIGRNSWYLAPDGPADVIVKVRVGEVQEIGLANKLLSESPGPFLVSLGASRGS